MAKAYFGDHPGRLEIPGKCSNKPCLTRTQPSLTRHTVSTITHQTTFQKFGKKESGDTTPTQDKQTAGGSASTQEVERTSRMMKDAGGSGASQDKQDASGSGTSRTEQPAGGSATSGRGAFRRAMADLKQAHSLMKYYQKSVSTPYFWEGDWYPPSDANLSEIIKDSMTKKDIMESFKMAKKYLNFVSTELLCIKHTDLDEKQKPFDKESLRGAFILLDILTNVKNNYHQMSPVQVKFSNIVKGKQLIEDFIKWHNAKVDKKATPEDFEQSEPKPGTYVIGTRTINPIGIKNRSLKIVEQFIVENMKKWNDEHYFSEQTDNYKKFTQFLLKENNYTDPYTKLGKEIRLRDKFNTDHIMATRGPNNGTDDVKNLVVTNPRSNKVKSNSV